MKILLFSTDAYFLSLFGGFLAKRKTEFDLFCYSDEEEAEKEIRHGKFDLILCEEGYLSAYQEDENYISLGMHTIYPKEGQNGTLNIYQKSERIMEELEYLIQILAGKDISENDIKMTMVSFFSTEGGSGKSTLAYLTAAECAKQKKILYINLEPLAATELFYQLEADSSMEDILLAFDEKKEESAAILFNAVKKNADGVYVFPTLKNIGDYLELSAATVLQMMRTAASMGGIESVILDLPGAFSSLTETVLAESKKIVWVYSDGRSGKSKLEKVKADPYLKSRGILSKSSYVLNRCENQEEGKGYHAAFPVSRTLGTATQITRILEVNEAFRDGCRNIARSAGIL